MSEKFDIKKLLSAPMTPLYWVKSTMFGLGIGMLVFVGYGLYKAYIKLPPPTTDQHAEAISNYTTPVKVYFGCAHIRHQAKELK